MTSLESGSSLTFFFLSTGKIMRSNRKIGITWEGKCDPGFVNILLVYLHFSEKSIIIQMHLKWILMYECFLLCYHWKKPICSYIFIINHTFQTGIGVEHFAAISKVMTDTLDFSSLLQPSKYSTMIISSRHRVREWPTGQLKSPT